MSAIWEKKDKYILPIITEGKKSLIGHSDTKSGTDSNLGHSAGRPPSDHEDGMMAGTSFWGMTALKLCPEACCPWMAAITIRCTPVMLGPRSPSVFLVHVTSTSSQIWVGHVLQELPDEVLTGGMFEALPTFEQALLFPDTQMEICCI